MYRDEHRALRSILLALAVGVFALPTPVSAQGSAAAGPLATGRMGQTATRLNNGTVFVAGGEDALAAALTSSEIFTPGPDTFGAGPSLINAREWHTATPLADGRVLLVGGRSGPAGDPVAATEVYDPVGNTVASVGNLVTPRYNHTATRLGNGKVLVVGGYDAAGNPVSTAELFDPATSSWGPAAGAVRARAEHTATLLADGRVLVTGGNPTARNIEFYHPNDSWIDGGLLSVGRTLHSATRLLDGKVLLVGGRQSPGDNAGAELFDPSTDTTTSVGSPLFSRQQHDAVLLPTGLVMVVGTNQEGGAGAPTIELFDPSANRFFGMLLLYSRRVTTATLLLDGRVLVAAGSGGTDRVPFPLVTAELFTLP